METKLQSSCCFRITATPDVVQSMPSQESDMSEEDDEADQEETEAIPSSLILDMPPPMHARKGRGPLHGSNAAWKDPRMENVWMPQDSKRINHTGTQVTGLDWVHAMQMAALGVKSASKELELVLCVQNTAA